LRRNLNVDSSAAAAFKSANYQGNFADLNIFVTALQNGILG
jgi:hypothetical protein